MKLPTLLFFFLLSASLPAQAVLHGTITFLNSGSQPAAGVSVSAFGANTVYSSDAGMFELRFTEKKPGDKIKILVGTRDGKNTAIELVNDKVVGQTRLPSRPDDDILEIIVCRAGQRDEAALQYNEILQKAANDMWNKRLREIDRKLEAKNIDAATITSLQKEKDQLRVERDSAVARAEEQALFMASINLDKASLLVKEAVSKVEQEKDISTALLVLDNEKLYEAYRNARDKKAKAVLEINQVVEGFELKIKLLDPLFRFSEIITCYKKIIEIYEAQDLDKSKLTEYMHFLAIYSLKDGNYQEALHYQLTSQKIQETIPGYTARDFANGYNNIGLSYIYLEDFPKALEFQKKALAIYDTLLKSDDPDFALLYHNIATTCLSTGQYEPGLEYCRKALSIAEAIPDSNNRTLGIVCITMGALYSISGNYPQAMYYDKKAVAIMEKILQPMDPELAAAYLGIAGIYLAKEEYSQALQYNKKALVIQEKILVPKHPDLGITYYYTGLNYFSLEEYDSASVFIEKALAVQKVTLKPDDPFLILTQNLALINRKMVGLSFFSKKEYQAAIDMFTKVLDQTKDLQVSAVRAFCHYYLGHYGEAVSDFNLVLQDTAYNYLYFYRAECHFYLKQYDPALADFNASRRDSTDSSFYNYRAQCHYHLGHYDPAILDYEKAHAINPDSGDSSYYNGIGMAYAKKKNFPAAHLAFTQYEKLNPKDGRSFRNWAVYYALQNDSVRAFENLRKALSLGFDNLEWIETDDSLESLRGTRDYQAIVKEMKKK